MIINLEYKFGCIIGYFHERRMTINSLYVEEEYRSKGYGLFLIEEILNFAYKQGIIHVELYDCSTNYRKKHNIYLKCGFRYIDDEKMYGNIRNVLFTLKIIKNIKI